MGFEVTYRATQFFIDRAEVQRKVEAGKLRALGRQGAFLRRRARTNILRRRKKVSLPGQPPSVHATDSTASLKNILFYLDPRTGTVVVGPVKLNQVNRGASGSISVPALMEFGGSVQIEEERYKGSRAGMWFRRDGRTRRDPQKLYRTRRANYRPRPFMAPALAAEVQAGTVAAAWANVVRAA
jgi:hypothetical protein